MNTNEETKYMDPVDNSQDVVEENVEDSKKETWKAVTIGGVSGILMGAGGLYAMNAFAENGEVGKLPEPGTVRTNDVTGMKVAAVSDDMSFGEAFATARQAVGGGGVFHWRGNVYNTFTKEEWDAMTPAERNAFAREAQPEITAEANLHPHHVNNHHDVADNHHHDNTGGQKVKENENVAKGGKAQENEEIAKGGKAHENEDIAKGSGKGTDDDDIKKVDDDDIHHASNTGDDDIHVVGTDEIDGHAVAFVDTTGNGEADVAIIDVDNDNQLTDADLIVDNEGNAMTLGGEIVSTSDVGYTQDDYDAGVDGALDYTI